MRRSLLLLLFCAAASAQDYVAASTARPSLTSHPRLLISASLFESDTGLWRIWTGAAWAQANAIVPDGPFHVAANAAACPTTSTVPLLMIGNKCFATNSGLFYVWTGAAWVLLAAPTLNQNTTGTAGGLVAAYIDWNASSGGASIKNKPTLGTAAAANLGTGSGQVPVTGQYVPLDEDGNATIGPTVLIDAVLGINDVAPTLLPKWRLALGKMRDGQADAKILCIGDSTTQGMGGSTAATVPAYTSYPWRLTSMLTSYGIPASPGLALAHSTLNVAADNRWTVGAGWAKFGFGMAAAASFKATNPGGNLVFTPGGGVTYDSFDVYFIRTPGAGSLTITATGGTPSVIDTATGTRGVSKTTVTAASAATTNAVTISGTGIVYVLAVEPFLSTTKLVRVGNAGVGSSQTADWATTGDFNSAAAIAAYAPDLTIVLLGVNDAAHSVAVTGVSGLQANMTTLLAAAKVTGDVIIMTPVPGSAAVVTTYLPLYQPVFYGLARTNAFPLLDLYARFGQAWNSVWMADVAHPNDAGYWDIAGAVAAYLRRVQ